MAFKINFDDNIKTSRMRKRANAIFQQEVAIQVLLAQLYGVKSLMKSTKQPSKLLTEQLTSAIDLLTEVITSEKVSLRDMVYIQQRERKSYRQSIDARRNSPARVAYRESRAEASRSREATSEGAKAYKAKQTQLSQAIQGQLARAS